MVSSTLNRSPSSPRWIWNVQPPCLKSSAPPGSSITPSSETNSVTTIFPIGSLLLRSNALSNRTSNERGRSRQALAACLREVALAGVKRDVLLAPEVAHDHRAALHVGERA